MKPRAFLAGAFVAVLSTSGAFAQSIMYKVELKSSEEVPPNTSKGTGSADVTYDPATKLLKWGVTYSGLTGAATMGHIHGPAEPGKNAPVIIPFAKVDSPITGSATLTDEQAAELKAGKLYINIHTAENKGGEIRGQLTGGK
ncbi:MAG: CHRD domain-containing protein [Rhodomicrobium sp.]